ncbi:TniB family NTP-binding protein [Acidovorax sp. 22279]
MLAFQQTLIDQVDIALDEVEAGKNSHGILLVGPSGTGKTHSIDVVCERVQARPRENSISPYQPTSPVCRYSAGAKADASSTASGLLSQLGKPIRSGGRTTVQHMEADLLAALNARRVRLLVFEEFNNAMLSGTPQLRGQTARLLKNIWNMSPGQNSLSWSRPEPGRGDMRLVILVSGTEDLLKVFEIDKELGSRFSTVVQASTLDFSPPDSFKAFRGLLKNMAELEALGDFVDPNDDELAARMLLACNAHLRRLEKLLQRTATLRQRREYAQHSMKSILAKSFEQFGGAVGENPFLLDAADITKHVSRRMQLLNKKMMI